MKRSLIGVIAVVSGVVMAQPAAAATTAPDCASYRLVQTLPVEGGVTSYPFSYFATRDSGRIDVCLDGSDGTNFTVKLLRFRPSGVQTVATAVGGGADKALSYDSGAREVYRLEVVTDIGGRYTVGVNHP